MISSLKIFFRHALLSLLIVLQFFSCTSKINTSQKLNSIDDNLSQTKYFLLYIDNYNTYTGLVEIKDSIGNKQITGYLKEGKFEGKWNAFYQSGQLKYERNYVNNKYHGVIKEYYINGQLASVGSYIDGERNGLHKKWYKNGDLKAEIYYIDGKIDGFWKQWDENGNMVSGVYSEEEESNFFKKLFKF